MSDIDDRIRDALHSEEAELLEQMDTELSLHEMVIDSFRTKARWLIVLTFTIMFVLMALSIFAIVRFFQAESVREMIAWAGGFFFCTMGVMGMKVWYWMELNRNAVTREIKRVELQLARLASLMRE
jgi:cytochrome c biogenesis protein CcdA